MKVLILAIALLTGCATASIPVVLELPLPEPLVLPKILGEELQHIDDDVYTRLAIILRMQRERIKTLRNIILTTHE